MAKKKQAKKATQANGSHKLTKPGPGRPKGVPNKVTVVAKELCQKLLERPKYRKAFERDWDARALEPQLEVMVWHYAYGKPKANIEVEAGTSLLDILTNIYEETADHD